MQNLNIENKFLLTENKNEIKKMWLENFLDDEENTADLFLENVFENKKGVGAFLNNKLIAMILFLNSKIVSENKNNNAIYFYAVCTDENYRNQGVMKRLFEYAKEKLKEQGVEKSFLVPAEDSLFKMYEKFSFKRTISYTEKVVFRKDVNIKNTTKETTDFCYNDYLSFRLQESKKTPVVILGEKEFSFIFDKTREDVSFLFLKTGYAVFEKTNSEILIFEICGNESDILSSLFTTYKDVEKITVRNSTEKERTDFGMTCSFLDDAEFNNIYFGMPYR